MSDKTPMSRSARYGTFFDDFGGEPQPASPVPLSNNVPYPKTTIGWDDPERRRDDANTKREGSSVIRGFGAAFLLRWRVRNR